MDEFNPRFVFMFFFNRWIENIKVGLSVTTLYRETSRDKVE